MKLIEIDKYLEIFLKTDPILFFELKEVNISVDVVDWGEFFYSKETV